MPTKPLSPAQRYERLRRMLLRKKKLIAVEEWRETVDILALPYCSPTSELCKPLIVQHPDVPLALWLKFAWAFPREAMQNPALWLWMVAYPGLDGEPYHCEHLLWHGKRYNVEDPVACWLYRLWYRWQIQRARKTLSQYPHYRYQPFFNVVYAKRFPKEKDTAKYHEQRDIWRFEA